MIPQVSIAIPSHGEGKFLEQALQSIENQRSELDMEIIVSLDNPTRELIEFCQTYVSNFKFLYTINPVPGLVSNRNLALSKCQGQYVAFLDSDDIMMNNRIQKQFDFMESNPSIIAVGSNFIKISESGEEFQKVLMPETSDQIMKIIGRRSPIGHPTAMVRNEIIKKLGEPYRNFYQQGEDHDLWLRLSNMGRLHNLQDFLTLYRVHDLQLSNKNGKIQFLYSYVATKSHKNRISGKIPIDEKSVSLSNWLKTPSGFFCNLLANFVVFSRKSRHSLFKGQFK